MSATKTEPSCAPLPRARPIDVIAALLVLAAVLVLASLVIDLVEGERYWSTLTDLVVMVQDEIEAIGEQLQG